MKSLNISIHDLPRRSTKTYLADIFDLLKFQSTTSRGGRLLALVVIVRLAELFQSTTSRGGRPVSADMPPASESFQSTTSRGGRPEIFRRLIFREVFQSTTSRGGRLELQIENIDMNVNFNPRPPEEVDAVCSGFLIQFSISIHDLPRRSTLLKLRV